MKFNLLAFAAAGLAISQLGSAAVIYAASNTNNLLQFNSATPTQIDSSLSVTGLSGENILGIDFRPADGKLYAVTNGNKLYTINTNTGAATAVGTGLGVALNGTAFGFDFNPSIDRLRIVSETDRNYVIDPNTGLATLTTNLAYGAGDPNFGLNPNVTGSAYSNNTAAAPSTQLYGIDTNLDILVKQANSAGTLTTVGSLGLNTSATTGFDIESGTGIAYAAMLPQGDSTSNLYTINLATGAATLLGQIDGGLNIVAMTVALPEPTTLAAMAASGLLFARRRRV